MILITGGMGFIGLHAAQRFIESGEDVVLTQHRSQRRPDFLKDYQGTRLHIEQLDVRNLDNVTALMRRYSVTGVAHLVAPPLNTLSPDDDFDTGVRGLLNVLQAARQANVRRVTLASSVGVYGGLSSGPFHEDALLPMQSRSATEAFKKTWEVVGLHCAERTGLDVVSIRIGLIYGPLFWHGGIFPVVRFCHAAARGGPIAEGPELFEDDEAQPCYAKDCAMGIEMLQHAEKLNHRIFNLSTNQIVTNRQIVSAIQKVTPDFRADLKPGKNPSGRSSAYLDVSRIHEDVGFAPRFDIETAVSDYIAWPKGHPEETMTTNER